MDCTGIDHLLGTMRDTDLARQLNIGADAVRYRRAKLGIAAFRPAQRLCRICGEKATHAVGLCHTHGERWRRWGKPPVEEWVAAFLAGALNTCTVCGRTWNGYHGSRTCSPECEMERRRREALARWHAKSEAEKAAATRRAKERTQRRSEERLVTVACAICGAHFVGLPFRRFCSAPCRSKRSTEINRGNRKAQYAARFRAQLAGATQALEHDQ